jgi:drug/metabolite transporter (DMT)-like permease
MAGISAAIAQFNITAAYQLAPAKSISVFDYTQVIFAAILGFLFLSEIPDIFSFIGYAVIIFAAIFKWEYGRRTSEQ